VKRLAVGLFATTAACLGQRPIALPDPGAMQSAIFVVQVEGKDPLLYASPIVSSRSSMPSFAAPSSATLTLLYYAVTLDQLAIREGKLQLATATDMETRPLPKADVVSTAMADRDPIAWSTVDASATPQLRMPITPLADCIARRGCFQDVRPFEGRDCFAPCPLDPSIPTPPAPPLMLPCPSGWAETSTRGIAYCEPPPRVRAPCGSDEAQWIDSASCVHVGPPCPAGDFADGLPAGAIYVKSGVMPGGTGSSTSPITLDEALLRAQPGSIIALAKGTYDGPIRFSVRVRIVGACTQGTQIVRTASDHEAITAIQPLSLEQLTISSDETALGIEGGSTVGLENVVLIGGLRSVPDASAGFPVAALRDGTLTGTSVVFHNLDYRSIETNGGQGLRLARAVLMNPIQTSSRAALAAIYSSRAPTTIQLEDVVLLGANWGVFAWSGTLVTMRRALIQDFYDYALYAGADGSIHAEDLVIDRQAPDHVDLTGLKLNPRGRLDLVRMRIRTNGYTLYSDGGSADLQDVIVLPSSGPGCFVTRADSQVPPTISFRRMLSSRCASYGVSSVGTLRLEDAQIFGSDMGLELLASSSTSIARTLIADSRSRGLCAKDNAFAFATDLDIERTQNASTVVTCPDLVLAALLDCPDPRTENAPVSTIGGGVAAASTECATLELQRFLFADNLDSGLYVYPSAKISARDGSFAHNLIGVRATGISVADVFDRVLFDGDAEAVAGPP
jgi:hypothetical protein